MLYGVKMKTTTYKYDQLNRLKSMDAWSSYNSNSWNSVSGPNNTLNTTYSYTANGNITALSRKDNTGNLFDDLEYLYTPGTNRLIKVSDSSPFDGTQDDIEDQTSSTNYTYDASGNMIGDAAEGLTIAWNYMGKVRKVIKSNMDEIEFGYDGMGQRVVKIVRPRNGDYETHHIYVRDASGNVMAVNEYIRVKDYIPAAPKNFMEYKLEELHIYGSSRLGLLLEEKVLETSGELVQPMTSTLAKYRHWVTGRKRYELNNHLGNVLSVISDRKVGVGQFNTLYFSYYTPDIRTATDYYPFGWAMPGRQVTGEYRYGFGGHEKDDEVKGDGNEYATEFRQYDPRLGRWMVTDPLASKGAGISPYAFCFNSPLLFIDPDGAWPWPIWTRSFISASSVAGGIFRGDGRGPSLSTDRSIATSRSFVSFTFDPQKQKIVNTVAGADPTIVFPPPELGLGYRFPIYSQIPEPKASFTGVSTEKNVFGNDIGSFGFSYSAKDPVTPGLFTPSLDVHSNFTITENLETGTLFINASFTGDVFPSTEAFISDQSGAKLFLGARKETGGVIDLFGDNKKSLFNVNMQIKFNDQGNFTGVQEGDTLISPEDWNKQIQSTWDKE